MGLINISISLNIVYQGRKEIYGCDLTTVTICRYKIDFRLCSQCRKGPTGLLLLLDQKKPKIMSLWGDSWPLDDRKRSINAWYSKASMGINEANIDLVSCQNCFYFLVKNNVQASEKCRCFMPCSLTIPTLKNSHILSPLWSISLQRQMTAA